MWPAGVTGFPLRILNHYQVQLVGVDRTSADEGQTGITLVKFHKFVNALSGAVHPEQVGRCSATVGIS